METRRENRAKYLGTPWRSGLIFLCLALPACTTPITTPDQMREAVLANRVRDVRHAVRAGFPLNVEVASCFPVLPFAAALGHERMVVAIVDAARTPGAIDQKNCMGHSALHFAAMTNRLGLERKLIARGASPSLRDHLERTADDLRPLPLSALP